MRNTFLGAMILAGLLAATSATAQTTTTATRCGYVNGVRTCTITTDSPNSTRQTTCQYGRGGDSNCTSDSQDKAPPQPSVQTIQVDLGQEKVKAEARAKAGYRDPNARVLACGAGYRMTERDGCQPARR